MMSETLEMNLRRNVKAWQHNNLPYVVTHNLVNDGADPVLNFLRMSNLVNGAEDKVKVVTTLNLSTQHHRFSTWITRSL